MQKIPQIVGERLKAGAAVSGHPDADSLTAFTERSLSERERAGVLTHLAACADCREMVALALRATDSLETAPLAIRRSLFQWTPFTWPAFRWGFAAAGVVLIVLGAVEFEQRKTERSATLATQSAPAPVAAQEQARQVQHEGASSAASPLPARPQQSVADRPIAKKETSQFAAGASRLRKKLTAAEPHAAPAITPSGTALVAKQTPGTAIPPASQMVTVQVRNENVEVQSAEAQSGEAQVAQAPVPNSFMDQSPAYNSGPLSRAKPASIQPVQSGVAGAMMSATPRWSITAVGGLQRSLDQGRSWQDISVDASTASNPSSSATALGGPMKTAAAKQNAIHGQVALKSSAGPIFFRAVSAAGNDVWAGGSNAALFHSADGGDHWTRVVPLSSGVALSGDIVSVEFPDSQRGTVTTSTLEIWLTSDGGETWRKQ